MREWVSVRYQTQALANTMALMRVWLDSRKCGPTVFEYERAGGDALIRIRFQSEDEAAAFARQFHGVVSAERPVLQEDRHSLQRSAGDD